MHGYLAVTIALFNLRVLLMWFFDSSTRIRSTMFYSPFIEISIATYAACTFGLRRAKNWAWWLALCTAGFFTLTNAAIRVLNAGVDLSRAGWSFGPFALFRSLEYAPFGLLLYLASLLALALLLMPAFAEGFEIAAYLRFLDATGLRKFMAGLSVRRVDGWIVRGIAIYQILLCLFILLLPYGAGFLPQALLYESFGVMSAIVLFQRQLAGKVLSMVWYAVYLSYLFFSLWSALAHPELQTNPLNPVFWGLLFCWLVPFVYLMASALVIQWTSRKSKAAKPG